MFPRIFPFPVLCARKVSRRANIFHFRTESRTSCLECAFLVRNPSYMAHCFPIFPTFSPDAFVFTRIDFRAKTLRLGSMAASCY